MRTVMEITTSPYIRVNAEKILHYNVGGVLLKLRPFMARLLADALLRAADRADPERRDTPPWGS